MRVFGLEIRRAEPLMRSHYSSVSGHGGWYPIVQEPYIGAWQRNDERRLDTVLSHPTVFRCVNLISSDIAKMRTRLVELRHEPDLWVETESSSFSPVLRRPNRYQTAAQFRKTWMISRLVHGNTYVLLERDNRGGFGNGNVIAMYVLDPNRVRPVVAPDGEVLYRINEDNLNGVSAADALDAIPASEIMHDRHAPLFHPLVGIPPLYAAGGPAHVGLTVQRNSSDYFDNEASPPGVLSGPAIINEATAKEMVARWHARRRGQIAALGNGLKYEPLHATAKDSQTTEHLDWTASAVCAAFGVPDFMAGAGPVPTLSNAELLTRIYFTGCLHDHAHDMEEIMDAGLGIGRGVNVGGRTLGVALDTAALLQMDTATQYTTLGQGVKDGLLQPNEARAEIDRLPMKGGDTVYLQQQQYAIEALADRDADKPFAKAAPAVEGAPAVKALPPGRGEDEDEAERAAARRVVRRIRNRTRDLEWEPAA